METVIVTGGAGFIGSHLVRFLLTKKNIRVIVFDKLTYAGHRDNLADIGESIPFSFVQGDIADRAALQTLFKTHSPTGVFHLAAETHVDRSIDGPDAFIKTNIVGTFELLEATRHYVQSLSAANRSAFRFLHVSTDEVYGSLGNEGFFSEETAYAPRSPYSASKAAADHLAVAYAKTYQLPLLITNCSNNYGPYQFPEKLIPLMVLNALEAKELPIYGDGQQVRDWLYVEDHVQALWAVYKQGRVGETYNVGARNERNNMEIVDRVCSLLDQWAPTNENPSVKGKLKSYSELKRFVPDRPGHDRRYATDSSKIEKELNWKPLHSFEKALEQTIRWYVHNKAWCERVQQGRYQRERLGWHRETA